MRKSAGKAFLIPAELRCNRPATRYIPALPIFDQVISQESDLGGLSGSIQTTEGYQ